jgi:hypothetical protein
LTPKTPRRPAGEKEHHSFWVEDFLGFRMFEGFLGLLGFRVLSVFKGYVPGFLELK